MSWGDPVGFSVDSFTQRDLEVGVHGIADVSIRSSFVGFGIPFDSRFESFDFVLKCKGCEAVDLFAILDGLDQTGGNLSKGVGIDVGIGSEYVLHSMGRVA